MSDNAQESPPATQNDPALMSYTVQGPETARTEKSGALERLVSTAPPAPPNRAGAVCASVGFLHLCRAQAGVSDPLLVQGWSRCSLPGSTLPGFVLVC